MREEEAEVEMLQLWRRETRAQARRPQLQQAAVHRGRRELPQCSGSWGKDPLA